MITFDPHINLKHIVMVGLGGTGAQWARKVARMVHDLKSTNRAAPQLHFVDPDVVEPKNIGRQLFAPQDVGQPKAAVVSRRFNEALGLDTSYRVGKFDDAIDCEMPYYTLICAAVDNHLAREAIQLSGRLWIDAGNHFDSGQVIVGNSSAFDFMDDWVTLSHGDTLPALPHAAALFPDLLQPPDEPEIRPDASCADLVASGDQHLLINDLMAAVAADYTYKLVYRQPIKSFMTYVSLDPFPGVRSVPITYDNLSPFIPGLIDART